MKVWVCRDNDEKEGNGISDSCIVFKEQEPEYNKKTKHYKTHYGDEDDFDMYISAPSFKKKFGFTPRKGSCEQVDLVITRTKP